MRSNSFYVKQSLSPLPLPLSPSIHLLDSLSDSNISLHHRRVSARDSGYAISADVSNVLPATPLEPDKLISGFAVDAFEHKLIAVKNWQIKKNPFDILKLN